MISFLSSILHFPRTGKTVPGSDLRFFLCVSPPLYCGGKDTRLCARVLACLSNPVYAYRFALRIPS